MPNSLRSICVFCGSADGLKQVYLDAAFGLGQLLARQGITLVYGAGKTGLMGAVADGALSAGGEVIGIVPHNLNTSALIHAGLTRLETSENMHTRKARMSELAEAFIALPGGLGTFDELFETLTWVQIGLHHKPVGLLNTLNYYDPAPAPDRARLPRRLPLFRAPPPPGALARARSAPRPAPRLHPARRPRTLGQPPRRIIKLFRRDKIPLNHVQPWLPEEGSTSA